MLTGTPFPRLHAKAAETKALLQPVSVALQHFRDQKPQEAELVDAMVSVLDCSHAIDKVVDGMRGFSVTPAAGAELERLVDRMNLGMIKLCHHFHNCGLFGHIIQDPWKQDPGQILAGCVEGTVQVKRSAIGWVYEKEEVWAQTMHEGASHLEKTRKESWQRPFSGFLRNSLYFELEPGLTRNPSESKLIDWIIQQDFAWHKWAQVACFLETHIDSIALASSRMCSWLNFSGKGGPRGPLSQSTWPFACKTHTQGAPKGALPRLFLVCKVFFKVIFSSENSFYLEK